MAGHRPRLVAGTERTYRSIINTSVLPDLGELCLREVTPGRVVRAIAGSSGPDAATTARACRSGMFALAIVDGAVTADPVRDAGVRVTRTAEKAPRALTPEDTTRLVQLFATSERAQALDLPDVVNWMLATCARIGEALAVRAGTVHGKTLLDLDTGTWEVAGPVVRVPKQGLVVQPRTKTAAGWRVVALPAYAQDIARRRLSGSRHPASGLVFPSPVAGTVRDPSNVSGDLRAAGLLRLHHLRGDRTVAPRHEGRTTGAVRGGPLVLGHPPHLPQDGRHEARGGRAHPTPGRRPARPRQPLDDPGRPLRPTRRQRRGRHRAGQVSDHGADAGQETVRAADRLASHHRSHSTSSQSTRRPTSTPPARSPRGARSGPWPGSCGSGRRRPRWSTVDWSLLSSSARRTAAQALTVPR